MDQEAHKVGLQADSGPEAHDRAGLESTKMDQEAHKVGLQADSGPEAHDRAGLESTKMDQEAHKVGLQADSGPEAHDRAGLESTKMDQEAHKVGLQADSGPEAHRAGLEATKIDGSSSLKFRECTFMGSSTAGNTRVRGASEIGNSSQIRKRQFSLRIQV
ncbi:hypothetical protein BJ508DRAFT_327607 [Ascobolus immersus RN42]|uniref:Uncharacterized protein n=1 Tax=Ascobolus immersus RN42 TaxID=1160509 RepID=A0A3N4IEH2_ASCIM|nr:hypothetical protein BJ508DRAFT_327607 [Ascobolus immersus RN42]